MKKHISITNPRVLEAFEKATKEKRASRLIEEAVIYYLDSLEHDYITREQVQSMILDALKTVEIKNPNYNSLDLAEELEGILDL